MRGGVFIYGRKSSIIGNVQFCCCRFLQDKFFQRKKGSIVSEFWVKNCCFGKK